jgi:hypothetical protein
MPLKKEYLAVAKHGQQLAVALAMPRVNCDQKKV